MINRTPQHIVQILNPDFHHSFNSSLNLAYVCIFELQKRSLLHRWQSLPSYTLAKVTYAFANLIRQKELTEFAEKLSQLEARPALPRINILTVWEQYRDDESQIAVSLRDYICNLVKHNPMPKQPAAAPRMRIKIYDTFHTSKGNGKWKKKKNIYAERIDNTIAIIRRMARKKELALKTARHYANSLGMWADLNPQQLDSLGRGLQKLAQHSKLEDEDSRTIESVALIIATGEIKNMHSLAKRNYSLADTFLGAPLTDENTNPNLDKEAQLAGRSKLEKMRAKMKSEGRI